MWSYNAFGLAVASSFSLPGMTPLEQAAQPSVAIRLGGREELAERWSGAADCPWETVLDDGCGFRLEAGTEGDHLFVYGGQASFHLSADARGLLCAPDDHGDPSWQRVLLDSVLFSIGLLQGNEGLHASAVEHPRGVVAFATVRGGGKTSLAAELVRRGRPLFCDDLLTLRATDDGLLAHPGPPLMNLPLADRPRHPAPAELGRVLATFGEEAWVAIGNASAEPMPPAAVYLLRRGAGLSRRVERLEPSSVHLLPHAVGFGHLPGRSRSRFELLARVAADVPLYRLDSDLQTGPSELADLVEESLASPSAEVEVAVR